MRRVFKAILPAVLCAAAGLAQAQMPGGKTITIIVPTTPGTGSDIAARLLAPRLSKALDASIVVENRTGASGTIGIGAVAKAAPDGATVLFVPNTMAMISSLYTNLTWDPVEDFEPVAQVGKMLVSTVVNPSVPARNLAELIALAKKEPGKLAYSSPGAGTPHHLRTEQFKQITGTDILHVPYKGSAGAVTDLAGGQVQIGMFPLHSILPMVHSGKLRILATSGDTRSPWTPEAPTFRESGINGLNDYDWVGVFLPKGTPQPVVDRLSKELLAQLSTPEVQKELADRGIIATPGTPAQLAALLKKELVEWKQVITAAKVVAD
ncbi:MAG: tripartite tricarboxylate transporter substrate binding protein [Pigmentiphaga sp.]|uniref:Bug family tripartite tricarboxylate transporter substrate binding protein n=1 Tax=Pigmentiphaga sp. TaxID=1977564 RepID=UPI0029B4ADCD|nr:tripartite tricarboxylate transporter substrate binding protein [Pigmentiphaga sp.]MDX3907185.1 tripartite tricarboxylate transporter substrate binding protein [Pigmentiphaga sp.]